MIFENLLFTQVDEDNHHRKSSLFCQIIKLSNTMMDKLKDSEQSQTLRLNYYIVWSLERERRAKKNPFHLKIRHVKAEIGLLLAR